jgi:hypothetical protein
VEEVQVEEVLEVDLEVVDPEEILEVDEGEL